MAYLTCSPLHEIINSWVWTNSVSKSGMFGRLYFTHLKFKRKSVNKHGLTLVLLLIYPAFANSVDPDVGFWRSQLIWICTVCHIVCEFVLTTSIMQSDWLTIRSGCGILIYSAWQGLKDIPNKVKQTNKKQNITNRLMEWQTDEHGNSIPNPQTRTHTHSLWEGSIINLMSHHNVKLCT